MTAGARQRSMSSTTHGGGGDAEAAGGGGAAGTGGVGGVGGGGGGGGLSIDDARRPKGSLDAPRAVDHTAAAAAATDGAPLGGAARIRRRLLVPIELDGQIAKEDINRGGRSGVCVHRRRMMGQVVPAAAGRGRGRRRQGRRR